MRLTRVLGIDPGKHNCFWGLYVKTVYRKLQVRLEQTGQIDMLPDIPINERLNEIKNQIVTLLKKTSPHLIAAERYIPRRGGLRGNLAEHVNIFLGILWTEASRKKIPIYLITASQHKKWREKDWYNKWPTLNPHQADSASIACFGLNKFSVEESGKEVEMEKNMERKITKLKTPIKKGNKQLRIVNPNQLVKNLRDGWKITHEFSSKGRTYFLVSKKKRKKLKPFDLTSAPELRLILDPSDPNEILENITGAENIFHAIQLLIMSLSESKVETEEDKALQEFGMKLAGEIAKFLETPSETKCQSNSSAPSTNNS